MAPGAIKRDAMPAQVVGKLQQAFRRRAEREMRLVIDGLGDRVAGFGSLLLGDFNDKVSDMIENMLGPAQFYVTHGVNGLAEFKAAKDLIDDTSGLFRIAGEQTDTIEPRHTNHVFRN